MNKHVLTLKQQLVDINLLVGRKVPMVNDGGCAFYAALIQQRLHELGHSTETGIISYTPPEGADHVFTVIKLGGKEYFHDGEDTTLLSAWKSFNYERLPTSETSTVVNSNRWNVVFNAEREVPILCEIIEKVLGPFEARPHFHTIQGIDV